MGKLTKRISPIKWLSAPSLNFQQGQSGQIKVRDYVHDPQRLLPTITLNGTLPSGCSFNGEDVSYDGIGVAASSSVTFTATTGTWSQTSSSTTCAIQAVQQNNPPVWATIPPQSVAEGYVGPVLDLANYCTDPDGDPITYGASGLPTGLTLRGSVIQADGLQVSSVNSITATATDDAIPPVSGDAEADWLYRAGLTKDGNGDLMVDWTNTAAAGVVFAHDFRYANEVNYFRGSEGAKTYPDATTTKAAQYPDPLGVGAHTVLQGSDGIPGSLGKCVQTWAPGLTDSGYFPVNSWADPVGGSSSSAYVTGPGLAKTEFSQAQLAWAEAIGTGGWLRPMVPFASNHGLPYADRAARTSEGGSGIPLFNWNPSDTFILFSEIINPDQGYWASAQYLDDPVYADENGLPGDNPKRIIGHEFWYQFRMKQTAGRNAPRADISGGLATRLTTAGKYDQRYEVPVGGKLAFLCDKHSGGYQEIIPFSGDGQVSRWENFVTQGHIDSGDVLLPYRQYTNFGVGMYKAVPGGSSFQPGGPYELTALTQRDLTRADAWYMPDDEWVTFMVHVTPGSYQPPYATTYYDWLIEVKAARWGETSWTTIWSAPYNIPCDANRDVFPPSPYRAIPGYNKLAFNCYMNSVPNFRRFDQIYTQVIFSTQEIPCPQVY